MVGVLGQGGVVVGTVPAFGPAIGVGGHCHRYFLVFRNLFPQQPHQLGVLAALVVGDVFNVHVHPVQIVLLHVLGNLGGEGLHVF